MHTLLAHAYHLARYGLHVLLLPLWWPPLVALTVAAIARALGCTRGPRSAGITVCVALLAGWLLLDPGWAGWPPPPVARLPGVALILLAEVLLPARPRLRWPVTFGVAAVAAWWLRGAPGSVSGIFGCVPVVLGLAAALSAARRLARGDDGSGSVAAALVLAAGVVLTGAATHWARAATVAAAASVVLLRVPGAGPALAGAIVIVAASTLVASDRGRLLSVDVACLVPLLAWPLVRRGMAR